MKRRRGSLCYDTYGIMKSKINYLSLGAWIGFCELVGFAAGGVTVPQIHTWYAGLLKPSFSPPNWVFAPVWIVLYAIMGYVGYRIMKLGKIRDACACMAFFLIQLFLNFIWSFIFFGSHNIPGGFVDIAVLWVVLLYLIARLDFIDRLSSFLLMPYIVWVSFAMLLNYYIWILNV